MTRADQVHKPGTRKIRAFRAVCADPYCRERGWCSHGSRIMRYRASPDRQGMRIMTAAGAVRAAGAVAGCLAAWSAASHWLAWRFAMGIWPVPSGTPWTYQLESGFVPALTVASLLGAILGSWHLHNCHHGGCWRIGKHRIHGTPWCSRHEAQGRSYVSEEVTLADLLAEQKRACELLARLAAGRRS
jgi:hypothetical protein